MIWEDVPEMMKESRENLGISHSLFNFLDRFVELDLGSVAPLQATTV